MSEEKYKALRIETEGRIAEEILMTELKHSDVFAMCYAYKSRVKSQNKLIEKKQRKIKKNSEYILCDITDVIGIRLVTLFRNEMPNIFKNLMEFILYENNENPKAKLKYSVEEVITFTTNQYDDIQIKIKEIFDAKKVSGKFENHISSEGYSSIHIVARLNHQVDGLHKNPYYLPVEIQIRTVFEDAWGEIDHKYGYVVREGKETGTSVENPVSVLKHLKVLKKFADACAEYADAIHAEAVPVESIDAANVVSVPVDSETVDFFRSFSIAEDLICRYKAARESRLSAQKERDEGSTKFSNCFLQAAELFRELAAEIDSPIQPETGNYIFYYYTKMSEAVCLLSTNQKDKVQAALTIYQLLSNSYTDFPLLKMRLAQAYGKLGYTENAIENFKFVHTDIFNFEKNECIFSEKLPESDFNHIKKFLPRLHGYQLWKKYESIKNIDKSSIERKIKLIIKAYEITKKSLDYEDGINAIKIHNNLLYYYLEYLKTNKDFESSIVFEVDYNIHLNEILKYINIESCNDLELLDTLSKAFYYNEDFINAEKIIDRITSLVFDPDTNIFYDRDIMFEIAQEAHIMKKKF